MWKREIQEITLPIFEIKGNMTTWSSSFRSGQNASSLHWRIQVYCHLLRQSFLIWGNVLSQTQKRGIHCIQNLQGLGQKTTWHHIKMQVNRLRGRVPVKWTKVVLGREQNRTSNIHARFSATKWTSGKVPANHRKWSWGYVASCWLIQQFLDICCEG